MNKMTSTKMKAIICTKYGSPDDLELKEVSKPTPKENEVLVKIHAASLNAADFEILRGAWTARMGGPLKPMHKIPGSDVAGTVEILGSNAKKFKPGDAVFGDLFMSGFGAFAEYVSVPEKVLEPKPASMTFEEVATYPQAGLIALQSVRGKKEIRPGHKVLINGAGGGMGTFGIQIAKYYGAEVTAVDNTEKLDFLRKLGADHVIDYTKEDYTKSGKLYDLVVDVAAHHSVFDHKRVLKPDGIFVVVGGARSSIFQTIFLGPLITMGEEKKMGLNPLKTDNKKDMEFLIKLYEDGKVKPVIDKRYSLSEVPEAYRYLEEGHAQGKLVVTMV
jgi:NADPH:quinone reductase-like Zn-dependent oxidoreductase